MDTLKGFSILIVDDEPDMLASIVRELRAEGVGVFVASGAKPALDLTKMISFDIILVDAGIPNVNGISLAMILRHKKVSSPIILMTGLLDHHLKQKLPAFGISGVIEKPFEKSQLLSALCSAIEAKPA